MPENNIKIVGLSDTNTYATHYAKSLGLPIIPPDEIYNVECDIFMPCALGGVLNKDTIPKLRCTFVAGCANNQLSKESDAGLLGEHNITYLPDFIINAGGLIEAGHALSIYSHEEMLQRINNIPHTMQDILNEALDQRVSTHKMATQYAEKQLKR